MSTQVLGETRPTLSTHVAEIKTVVVQGMPNEHFWTEYDVLWRRSRSRCPFQAPSYLRNLSTKQTTAVTSFCLRLDGQLSAVGIFYLAGKTLRFLSDLRSDQNNFVIDRALPQEVMVRFFADFLHELVTRSWKVVLHKCPSDCPGIEALVQALRESRVFNLRCDYAVCPVLAAEDGPSLYAIINRSKNQRFKLRRFVRRENLSFEVLSDTQSLEPWLTEFFQLHVLRWQREGRHSKYRSSASRSLLSNCLKAWTQDGVAVRFALKKGSRRLVMALVLRQGDALIGNLQAFDPAYAKNSPGRSLLNFIGQWMADQDISRLNFGEGGEAYKYEYANQEQQLHTYFIAKRSNVSFRIMAHFMTFCRHSKVIEWLMQHVRHFRQLTWKRADLRYGEA